MEHQIKKTPYRSGIDYGLYENMGIFINTRGGDNGSINFINYDNKSYVRDLVMAEFNYLLDRGLISYTNQFMHFHCVSVSKITLGNLYRVVTDHTYEDKYTYNYTDEYIITIHPNGNLIVMEFTKMPIWRNIDILSFIWNNSNVTRLVQFAISYNNNINDASEFNKLCHDACAKILGLDKNKFIDLCIIVQNTMGAPVRSKELHRFIKPWCINNHISEYDLYAKIYEKNKKWVNIYRLLFPEMPNPSFKPLLLSLTNITNLSAYVFNKSDVFDAKKYACDIHKKRTLFCNMMTIMYGVIIEYEQSNFRTPHRYYINNSMRPYKINIVLHKKDICDYLLEKPIDRFSIKYFNEICEDPDIKALMIKNESSLIIYE